ncbi:hypothetical protein O3P69_000703 [Scylla paramamosain]|uniref:Uncharacterized protein n=1 Tax=Scylla paramamosain TaxID=85552 RepID=A0AAW0UQS3_SCYPA
MDAEGQWSGSPPAEHRYATQDTPRGRRVAACMGRHSLRCWGRDAVGGSARHRGIDHGGGRYLWQDRTAARHQRRMPLRAGRYRPHLSGEAGGCGSKLVC